MTRHLCVSVTFLTHAFHGSRSSVEPEPEWPPSPMRLYQALVAGAHTGARTCACSDATTEAFRWLERQAPPIIVAPNVRKSVVKITTYVPNNQSDVSLRREGRLTSKSARPHVLGDDRTVHYLWPLPGADPDDGERHASTICHQARHLTALGWGIDLVIGSGRILSWPKADALHGIVWIPLPHADDSGTTSHVIIAGASQPGPAGGASGLQTVLRVPTRGSLDDLEAVYASFRRKLDGSNPRGRHDLTAFNKVRYTANGGLPARWCAVFTIHDGAAIPQVNAVTAAAMLRSLVCRDENRNDFADRFGDDPEVYLAGHVQTQGHTPPRFSYLPLPTIGHEHADGRIRRLMIAEPRGGSGERAVWAARRLFGQPLSDRTGAERGILGAPLRRGSDGVVQLYTARGTAWASVTPVVLPGYDKACYLKAERLFLKAVKHAGIPLSDVSDVTLRKAPFWPGGEHPRAYRRPDYLLGHSAWHAHVVFRRTVSGPVAIGSGRHCGLGVFAAMDG